MLLNRKNKFKSRLISSNVKSHTIPMLEFTEVCVKRTSNDNGQKIPRFDIYDIGEGRFSEFVEWVLNLPRPNGHGEFAYEITSKFPVVTIHTVWSDKTLVQLNRSAERWEKVIVGTNCVPGETCVNVNLIRE